MTTGMSGAALNKALVRRCTSLRIARDKQDDA